MQIKLGILSVLITQINKLIILLLLDFLTFLFGSFSFSDE
jgi:hypothetical protein